MKLIRTYADKHLSDRLTLAMYAENHLLSFVYSSLYVDFDPEQHTGHSASIFNTYNMDVDAYLDDYCIHPLTKKDNETITVIST